MIDMIVGCRTDMPDGDNKYFLVEMEANDYIYEDMAEELAQFLNENQLEIVDAAVFVMDAYSGDIIWDTGE